MRSAVGILVAFGIALASSAHAQTVDHGFLALNASTALLKKSESVTVRVGLFDEPDDKRTGRVWFYGVFGKHQWTSPSRFRWTDSDRCPQALIVLRKVRRIAMPKAVLPIPDPEHYEPTNDELILDGRIYSLDVSSSSLEGQMTSEIHFSSNVETQLASWAEEFLSALAPCWSSEVPKGVDELAGTKTDAELRQQRKAEAQ